MAIILHKDKHLFRGCSVYIVIFDTVSQCCYEGFDCTKQRKRMIFFYCNRIENKNKLYILVSFEYCTVQMGEITDISEELSAFTSGLKHKSVTDNSTAFY